MTQVREKNAHDSLLPCLSTAQCRDLLQMARTALTQYLLTGQIPVYKASDPILDRPFGIFVTLRQRVAQEKYAIGQLRGCVGNVQTKTPLRQLLPEMAVKAGTCDPRFPSLTSVEIKNIHIELSILSPLEPTISPEQIVIGRHGLVLDYVGRRGVLLPQVPVERSWDRDTFLRHLCYKAGLPPDFWSKADLHRFETLIIEEV